MKKVFKAFVMLAAMVVFSFSATIAGSAACSHSYNSQTVRTPTCTQSGLVIVVCTKCGNILSRTKINALGHNYRQYTTTKAPTCTESGVETASCVRCSATTTRTLNPLGHSMTVETIIVQPTETTTGTKRISCDRNCGYYVEVTLPKLPSTGNGWSYMFREPNMAVNISQPFPYYRDGSSHNGIDITNNGINPQTGQSNVSISNFPIYGVGIGTAVNAGFDSDYGRGEFVEIDLNNGYTVRYLHMVENSSPINVGSSVTSSSFIGRVGKTGYASGYHLHFDVRLTSKKGINDSSLSYEERGYRDPKNFFPNVAFTNNP